MMVLFVLLGLLLLSALLGTIIWFLKKMAKQNKSLDKRKQTKTTQDQQHHTIGYHSYKQNESQEGLGTENLIRKDKDDLYSTPNEAGTARSTRGKRTPLYTTTSSTVKIRETYDRTIDDGNVYDKAGTGTDTGTGTGGETTGRSDIAMDSNGRKQMNTAGIRRNGYQMDETGSLPRSASSTQPVTIPVEHYSTRETFEERCEENYIAEEEQSISYSDRKELL